MKETKIEWCDSTINGSSGCDGCELWNRDRKSCYAGNVHESRWAKSLAVTKPAFYDPSFDVVKMIPGRFARAARWSDLRGKKRPEKPWLNGLPRMIFVGDMGDFLSRDVTDEFLMNELFGEMTGALGRRHFWLLLTKQPLRLLALSEKMNGLPDNCMAMTSATDQRTANYRVMKLLQTKCRWRGVSCEPIVGHIDLTLLRFPGDELARQNALTGYGICDGMNEPAKLASLDWVIGGFESGKEARIGDPAHAYKLRDDCLTAGVPFFWKQFGEWAPDYAIPNLATVMGVEHAYVGGQFMARVGKKNAARHLRGEFWNQMPALLAA